MKAKYLVNIRPFVAILILCTAVLHSEPTPDIAVLPAERIKEVSSYVESKSIGLGIPISDRKAWDKFSTAHPGFKSVMIATADRMLVEPIPEWSEEFYLDFTKNGNRERFQKMIADRRRPLGYFVIAECMENKGRFIPAIEKKLVEICSERTWTMPAHDSKLLNFNGIELQNDLGSAMTAWTVSTVDWVMGDKVSPATRQLVRKEVRRRVLEPFLAEIRRSDRQEWWRQHIFNWNAVVHAGIVGAATMLDDSLMEKAEIIAATEQDVKFYLKGFRDDGYAMEGVGYWNYGFGHYVLLAETILKATNGKINLYADEKTRVIAEYPSRLEIFSNIYPAFADCKFGEQPSEWIQDIVGNRYGFKQKKDESERAIGVIPYMFYITAASIAFDTNEAPVYKSQKSSGKGYRIRDSFEDCQIFVARPAEGVKGLGLAFKGGMNDETPHSHHDLGSYIVALGKEQVLVDPGGTIYTSSTFGPHRYENRLINSYGHSVPVVGEKLQKNGKDAVVVIKSKDYTESLDSWILDLTKCYEVDGLKELTRRFDYVRSSQGAITVTDRVVFSSPQKFATALMTYGKMKEIKVGTYLIYRGHYCVQAEINTGGIPFTVKDEEMPEDLLVGRKVRRIGIELQQPITSGEIKIKLTPATSPVPSPYYVEVSDIAKLKPDYKRVIEIGANTFIKDRESGGKALPTFKVGADYAIDSWSKEGHSLTWKVEIPQDGTYALQLRYSFDNEYDAKRELSIDGKIVSDTPFYFPSTGGWGMCAGDWEVAWCATRNKLITFQLTRGAHEITLTCKSGGIALDALRLVPVIP